MRSSEKPTFLEYRPEIDGLRAVAVIAVVLYHARLDFLGRDWFSGGYLGVDIFFVISGYLITRIILVQIKQPGGFSFRGFYERRARRILPMLIVVIIASIPFAWARLLPVDFIEYAESMLASIFFASNFFFYFSTTEYAAESALLKPLLHTWSLGVEEQFYLLFPVLALLLYRLRGRPVFAGLLTLSLLSLVFAETMETINSELNFFLPVSRIWELAAGSILALRELAGKREQSSTIALMVWPLVGLILIIAPIFYFNVATPHPGLYTLFPVLGVMLVIRFSASGDLLVYRLLACRPLVFLGLISYSIYLWHYPIFAFARVETAEPGLSEKLIWIILTLFLSLVSYKYIEKPFRSVDVISSRLFFVTLALAVMLLVMVAASIKVNDGYPSRLPPVLSVLSQDGVKPWFSIRDAETGEVCHNRSKPCVMEASAQMLGKRIAIVGDSEAAAMARVFIPELVNEGYVVSMHTKGACPFYLGSDVYIYHAKQRKEVLRGCGQGYQQARLDAIREFGPDVIVHVGRLDKISSSTNLKNPSAWVRNAQSLTGAHLVKYGVSQLRKVAPIIYVQPLPREKKGVDPANHLLGMLRGVTSPEEIKTLMMHRPYEVLPDRTELQGRRLLVKLVGSDGYLDTWQSICDLSDKAKPVCQAYGDGGIYYYDRSHPSDDLSRMLYPALSEKISRLLD